MDAVLQVTGAALCHHLVTQETAQVGVVDAVLQVTGAALCHHLVARLVQCALMSAAACVRLSVTQVGSAFDTRNHAWLWQAGDSASIWRYAQSREQASASPWHGASRPSHGLALHTRWSMWIMA